MSKQRQLISWALIAVLLFVGIYSIRGVLLPFVVGFAIAYFLDPVVDKLEERKFPRWLATSLVLFVFFAALIAIALMLVPVLHSQFVDFTDRLPGYLARIRENLIPFLERMGTELGLDLASNAKSALPDATKSFFAVSGKVLARALSGGLAVFNLISLAIISPIVAFYLVRDWDLIVARVESWLPRDHDGSIRKILQDIDTVLAGFVRGQGTVCLILAAYYGIALSLAGLEFGLVIGIFSGFVSFIPFVGAILGLVLSMLTAVTQFWPDFVHIGIIAAIFFVGQFLEGNVLTPRLLGDRVGLHPVWVIFALMAGGALFGFVGILIAVPAAAVIGVLARYGIGQYLGSRLYLGVGPLLVEPDSAAGSEPEGTLEAAVEPEGGRDGSEK